MAKVMKKIDRLRWLFNYQKEFRNPCGLSTTDTDFVREYIEATNCSFTAVLWGAPRCKLLVKDLKFLFDHNIFARTSLGIALWENLDGGGKWTYFYMVKNLGKPYESLIEEIDLIFKENKDDDPKNWEFLRKSK